jgi:DNA-binding GntR family transcriptional regulator
MNDVVKRTTLSESAYEELRRQITTGVFAPGAKLVVGSLAGALQLSATPVNEALAALEREGLVTYAPHRGYFVSDITPEQVAEMYSVREVFELMAVRMAAQKADPQTVQRLRELLRAARDSIRDGDMSSFSDLDVEFHRVIWTSTNNALAMRIGELINGQIRLLVATTARAPGRFRGAFEEHSEIYQAIRDADPKAAVNAMRKHIRNAGTALARASAERDRPRGESSTTRPPRRSRGQQALLQRTRARTTPSRRRR